jgi:hypothetical protein
MARTFDYLHAANDILTEAGVELPLSGQSVQGRIVGNSRERLLGITY